MPLPEATLRKLYRDRTDYVAKVEQRLEQLMAEGWFLPEYAAMVLADARSTALP